MQQCRNANYFLAEGGQKKAPKRWLTLLRQIQLKNYKYCIIAWECGI